jgi:uncharacterized membrane protein
MLANASKRKKGIVMEKMLVVVFDSEAKAYEASRGLNQLDLEGSIAIHAESVISKEANGTVKVKQAEGDFPIRTITGTAIGSLIGILGGPVGVAVGAGAGMLAGSFSDLFVAGVDSDFLAEVSTILTPGKHAIVADISEEWVTPIDTRMEALNGVVFRTTSRAFAQDQTALAESELRAQIDQLRAEHARARAEHKAKLQAKIDALHTKLQSKLDLAKQRSEQIKQETEAKVNALQKKAAKAQGEIRATMDARVKEIRGEYDQAVARAKSMVA